MPAENLKLAESTDHIAASDLYALVDAPSMDSSLKDGYAVLSHEVADATPEMPVRLKLAGHLAAGGKKDILGLAVKAGVVAHMAGSASLGDF